MKSKKGFTLIELLAVIVILAVIALIATPIIVGIINDAEKKAFEDTVYGIVKAGELHYGQEVMKDSDYIGETLFLEKDELAYSGEKVKGTVLIENDGKVTASIYDKKNRWCAIKEYGSEKPSIRKYEEGKCNVAYLYPVMQKWAFNSTTDFHNEAYRTKIKTVEFVGHKNIPAEAIETWDVSESKDGSVMAWITDAGEGFYHLYIGGDRRVSANVNSSYLFYSFTNVVNIDVDLLYTGNVIEMSAMFLSCGKLIELDVSKFNTSKVTNMASMFAGCNNIVELSVSNFDTSNVINMYQMFSNCNNLTKLDVSKFNTSKVTEMASMFAGCSGVVELNVSGFDTSKVINMRQMFNNCRNLTKLDVSKFNTSKVTNMASMFAGCNNIVKLSVSDFDTSKVTDMQSMFSLCSNLIQLDVSNLDTSNVIKMDSLFYKCTNLKELKLGVFEHDKVTMTTNMFSYVPNTTKIIVGDVATQSYILGLPETDRPMDWSTSNVVIG